MTDADAQEPDHGQRVAVAATFTADSVTPIVDFWAGQLPLPMSVTVAPYGQVFQQLLDPDSTLARNRRGLNVVLIRWTDLVQRDAASSAADRPSIGPAELARAVGELADAVRDAATRWSVPVLVIAAPTGRMSGPGGAEAAAAAGRQLAAALAGCPNVDVVDESTLEHWYPGALAVDSYTERLADVPYGPSGFAAVGTAIVRRLYRILAPAPKVVVVDADHTLWDGVAGEGDGSEVSVGPARQAVQRLLREQRRAGRLLVLCSKNNSADTTAVLAQHPDMILRPDDFVARCVNWRPKSENLRDVATQLGLGLDSFVFIDDSPIECAEIRDRCLEVAVVQLPAAAQDAERLLRQCWILDPPAATADDARRTDYYRDEAVRQRSRQNAPTLRSFVDSLDLRVEVQSATADHVARVAQLSQRTNQFNLAATRWTVAEVRDRLAVRDCFVVTVADRFGSYGLVGVASATTVDSAYRVEAFLLSCRALGRGVEHRVLAALGERARDRGLESVELVFRRTKRNQPAADFVRDVGAGNGAVELADGVYRLSAAAAAGTVYSPSEQPVAGVGEPTRSGVAPATAARTDLQAALWAAAGRTGSHPIEAVDIAAAAQPSASTRSSPVERAPASVPALCALIGEVLGVDPVDADSDFFALGGTSLQLIRLMSRIRDSFGVELPMDTLYVSQPTARNIGASVARHGQILSGDVASAAARVDSMTDDEVEAALAALD